MIVPTRNSEAHLARCLASIRDQSYDPVELIVVDNASTDQTPAVAADFTDMVLTAGPERSAQRNAGAKAAQGAYLFFIDSDMVLEAEVVAECVAAVRSTDAEAVVVPEVSFGTGFWARCKAFERSFYRGDETIEAARFFPADIFWKVGGFDESMPAGPEDWDLDERFRLRERPIARTQSVIHHDEGQPRLLSLMRKKFYYGRGMPIYVRRHPERARKQLRLIRPAFLTDWRRLVSNPATAAGMLFMKSCEFAAGGLGFLAGRLGEVRHGRPGL